MPESRMDTGIERSRLFFLQSTTHISCADGFSTSFQHFYLIATFKGKNLTFVGVLSLRIVFCSIPNLSNAFPIV